MRFEMLSFKNSLFFFLPYTWGVMMVPFILLRVFHRWWWSQEETGFSKSFLFGWVLRENWRQVLAISWRSVPSAVRHVSSIANNSSEIPLQRVTCWRRGLYSECDTREAWEILFLFPFCPCVAVACLLLNAFLRNVWWVMSVSSWRDWGCLLESLGKPRKGGSELRTVLQCFKRHLTVASFG